MFHSKWTETSYSSTYSVMLRTKKNSVLDFSITHLCARDPATIVIFLANHFSFLHSYGCLNTLCKIFIQNNGKGLFFEPPAALFICRKTDTECTYNFTVCQLSTPSDRQFCDRQVSMCYNIQHMVLICL